jgi:hypothetical protein
MRRQLALAPLGAFPSCPKVTYGKVLASDLVGDAVIFGATGLGALAGAATARAAGKNTKPSTIAGAAVGLLASLYPSLLARRAAIRNPSCPSPGLGSLLVYSIAKMGIGALAGVATQRALPEAGPYAASAVTLLLAPIAGRHIIET